MKLGIATCFDIPEPDVDEAIVLEAFRRHGHDTELFAWEDPARSASEFDAVIVRSTWNYPERPEEFADWIRLSSTQTRLLNPADVMVGNIHKGYLFELAERGVPVVETTRIWPSDASRLRDLITVKSVVKPMIGAGSWDTRVFLPEAVEEAVDWLGGQEPHREFMVQAYLESVDTVGEQSIIVIGDEPSHRIRKNPRFADGEESVEGPFTVEPEFAELARKALEPYRGRLLYARVDLMMLEDGRWVVSELELIEPSLFFKQKPEALDVLVKKAEQLLSL